MKLSKLKTASVVIACFLTIVARAQTTGARQVEAQVLATFAEGTQESVWDLCRKIGAAPVDFVPELNTWQIKLPRKMSVPQGVAYFKQFDIVQNAQPDYVYLFDYVPNDTDWFSQYAPQTTRCPQAWDVTKGSPSTVIAVVDSGVDPTHPDLSAKLAPGWDFGENDPFPDDNVGHGTRCAGAAAADTDNGLGIAGAGFKCRVMPLKVSDAQGIPRTWAIVKALLFAKSHGADIVSMSFGSSTPDNLLHSAILYGPPVLYVAAAGNDNSPLPRYPAAWPEVVSVGATDANDAKAAFSNYGANWVGVAAPGVHVYLPERGGGYSTVSGTSYAAPLVAGIMGLLFSYLGSSSFTSPQYARECLENTCDPVGNWVKFGRVNAELALNYVPAGQTRSVFSPKEFVVTNGTLVYGGQQQIASSDDDRLRMDAAFYSGTTYLAVGYARAFVQYTGNLREIQVTLEERVTTANTAPCGIWLWRWSDSKWIFTGSCLSKLDDETRLYRRTALPTDFVGPRGEVRVQVKVDSVGPFEVQADWIQVAVVCQ